MQLRCVFKSFTLPATQNGAVLEWQMQFTNVGVINVTSLENSPIVLRHKGLKNNLQVRKKWKVTILFLVYWAVWQNKLPHFGIIRKLFVLFPKLLHLGCNHMDDGCGGISTGSCCVRWQLLKVALKCTQAWDSSAKRR